MQGQKMLAPSSLAGADPKVVWELNRHHHLVTLAQAFVASNDARYKDEILAMKPIILSGNLNKIK